MAKYTLDCGRTRRSIISTLLLALGMGLALWFLAKMAVLSPDFSVDPWTRG